MARAPALERLADPAQAERVVRGVHADPFAFLGAHALDGDGPVVVRVFRPDARGVRVAGAGGEPVALERVRDEGLFAGVVASTWPVAPYRLLIETLDGARIEAQDPYRFGLVLASEAVFVLKSGRYWRAYEQLGATRRVLDGVEGVAFAVWAPEAARVSLVGEFNDWDPRRHPMRWRHDGGIWEIFIPELGADLRYGFHVLAADGSERPVKSDPYASRCAAGEPGVSLTPPAGPRLIADGGWSARRPERQGPRAPVRVLSAPPVEPARLAAAVLPRALSQGFTHVRVGPIAPADPATGLPIAPFALDADQDDAWIDFVEACRAAEIGVLLDWRVAGFADRPYGLTRFDGSTLYEARDPRGPAPGALRFDYARWETANYLAALALWQVERRGADGLWLDDVDAVLTGPDGAADRHAVDLLRQINELAAGDHPGALLVADGAGRWAALTKSTRVGGLQFGARVDRDLAEGVRRAFGRGGRFAFEAALIGANAERGVTAADPSPALDAADPAAWAAARAARALAWTLPGKKLAPPPAAQAGAEPQAAGLERLLRDANRLHAAHPALSEQDFSAEGLEPLAPLEPTAPVSAFVRWAEQRRGHVLVAANFSDRPATATLPAPAARPYREALNSDWAVYGGATPDQAAVHAPTPPRPGAEPCLKLTLPASAVLVLEPA